MIRPIATYTVAPELPTELECLRDLAYNLYWVWNQDAMELFIRLDPDLWEQTNHNPVLMLGMVRQDRLNTASRDEAFLAQIERAWRKFQEYMAKPLVWPVTGNGGTSNGDPVAYLSAEFGITEALPNYSGGLGILAGDHLKSASDLGIPLVGVGLLYQEGYFRQYLNADGWQQERYIQNDFYTLPVHQELDAHGTPLTIGVDLPGRILAAQIWRVRVGRISLYLLDTNIPQNTMEDQAITSQLYGGDREMRLKQEILLGIGGYRALGALGIHPAAYHLNEGHSAFLILERCRDLMETNDISFAAASEIAMAGIVFTTHTPVPAGNEYFSAGLIDTYLTPFCQAMGLRRREFIGLGRANPDNDREDVCMTILALRLAGKCNGVSRLHGAVSRTMWQHLWPGLPVNSVPIISITNGVHAPSWISREMASLFDRYLGPYWNESANSNALWSRVHHIPDEELWRTHERRRERLVAFARQRLQTQMESRGASSTEVAQAAEVLNSEALTIGFGRRFATYKRATLLLKDPERFARILNSKDHPVQIIFAGKSHPLDTPGKELIRQIVHFERRPEIRRRMVFLEDYDMVVARYLLQGVDVWLNTPRRPLEASGTSGMKATFNGGLNLSILDGWWEEAYSVNTGWSIGRGEEYTDQAYEDEVQSNTLYDLLEKEITPLFYTRGADDLPRAWISKMKMAMRAIGPYFNTNRMVQEYAEKMYVPSLIRSSYLGADGFARAKSLASWKLHLRREWGGVRVVRTAIDNKTKLQVGQSVTVRAMIELGRLTPDDLAVELYYGMINARGEIGDPRLADMHPTGRTEGSASEFGVTVLLSSSGRIGHTVRILPRHVDLEDSVKPGLIVWAGST